MSVDPVAGLERSIVDISPIPQLYLDDLQGLPASECTFLRRAPEIVGKGLNGLSSGGG